MKKLYTVADNIRIPSLGIQGPLTQPTKIEETDIITMVRKYGATVYEHNPDYPKEKVQVTKDNYKDIVFTRTRKEAALERIQKISMKGNETKIEPRKKHKRNGHNVDGIQKVDSFQKPEVVSLKDDDEVKAVTKPDAFTNTSVIN